MLFVAKLGGVFVWTDARVDDVNLAREDFREGDEVVFLERTEPYLNTLC